MGRVSELHPLVSPLCWPGYMIRRRYPSQYITRLRNRISEAVLVSFFHSMLVGSLPPAAHPPPTFQTTLAAKMYLQTIPPNERPITSLPHRPERANKK